jgi:hypothetical protein
MLDARTWAEIPPRKLSEAHYWRDVPFVWTRWTNPANDHREHNHCGFCWACICDARDRDPYDKPGLIEGGHYRHAYYAENPEGIFVWVCRSCFKRISPVAGWTRSRRNQKDTLSSSRLSA